MKKSLKQCPNIWYGTHQSEQTFRKHFKEERHGNIPDV